MADIDEGLDLLDLEDDTDLDTLPEAGPFTAPRPKKPWLLLGVGLLVIALATYIIIRVVGTDSDSSIKIDLDAPTVETVDTTGQPTDTLVVPPVQTSEKPATVIKPAPAPTTSGTPVRQVADRPAVKFNPNKVEAKPVVKKTTTVKTSAPVSGSYYVQFGSYSTRALAESAQKKIQARHSSLFTGKQFVVLAAVLPNGTTTYRLRVAFANSSDANGFCRNAKSDGLDCYVAR